MEIFLLLLVIFWFGDPQWMGRHLSKTRQWYDYYMREPDPKVRRAIAKRRAKNIRRIRNERFKRNKT